MLRAIVGFEIEVELLGFGQARVEKGFMPLARSVAQAEGVCLLHHSELDGVTPDELAGAARPRRQATCEVQGEEDALDASARGKAVRVFGRR